MMSMIEFTEAIEAHLDRIEEDSAWNDYWWFGVRVQRSGAEVKRTKAGSKLHASHEWVDGDKTRRKLSGTAGFTVCNSGIRTTAEALRAMSAHGYHLRTGDRLVLIASKDGCWGDDMPEQYAASFKNAVLVAIL